MITVLYLIVLKHHEELLLGKKGSQYIRSHLNADFGYFENWIKRRLTGSF